MKGAAALVAASRHPQERLLLVLAMLVTVGGVLGMVLLSIFRVEVSVWLKRESIAAHRTDLEVFETGQHDTFIGPLGLIDNLVSNEPLLSWRVAALRRDRPGRLFWPLPAGTKHAGG
ncbi:MAG: hypothetical protein Q4E06_09785 [Lautropia sp.]|nr:hypothetical protein [Lautropia sp.]